MGALKNIQIKLMEGQVLTEDEEEFATLHRAGESVRVEGLSLSIIDPEDDLEIVEHEMKQDSCLFDLKQATGRLLDLGLESGEILCEVAKVLAEQDPVFRMQFMAKVDSNGK